ncbi:TetR/AcrR family transcriptional regulator [Mycobacterium hubeiense]|uniref:TetR/AcrR family transcriptional regulator n=1 Tax=Mycobacterium hubeiense TaxID=1867256 RepID=UPI000C7F4474|nr:TetR/AcrR family transcriptional regulator [Mycobacterium sp. QGD 101]
MRAPDDHESAAHGVSASADMPESRDDSGRVDQIRNRVLDGAEACLARYGPQKTTIDDIAKAAGMSRATIYRYVEGGRDAIILEVLLRICIREMGRLVVELPRQQTSIAGQLTEGIVQCLGLAETDERLALLFSPEVLGFAGGIRGAADALIDGLAKMLQPLVETARLRGEVRHDLGDRDIAQFVCHLMVASLVLRTRHTQGENELRLMLQNFLVPGLAPGR